MNLITPPKQHQQQHNRCKRSSGSLLVLLSATKLHKIGSSSTANKARIKKSRRLVLLLLLAVMMLMLLVSIMMMGVSLQLSSHVLVSWVKTTTMNETPPKKSPEVTSFFTGPDEGRQLATDSTTTTTTSMFYTKFPSLQPFLEQYDIVALYFAAAWCPMSTEVTELLHDTFSAMMMDRPMPMDQQHQKEEEVVVVQPTAATSTKLPFALVYISSDSSQTQFDQYRKFWWKYIPYNQVTERQAIKRYLRTCAKREMEGLGISAPRDAEIPHLDILRHGQLLTREGIADVRERGSTAIDYWLTAPPHGLQVSMKQ